MSKWLFESPDGGETIIRRPSLMISDENREILVEPDGDIWLSITDLRTLGRRHLAEHRLRMDNPHLMELWNQYQVMLKLLRIEVNDLE